MLHKQFASNLAASLAVYLIIGTSIPTFAADSGSRSFSEATSGESTGIDGMLLAHHEGATSSVGAVDLLGTESGGASSEALSDSLWGNLLLQMAYTRDKQLGRSAKKMKLTDNLTLGAIYGIAGVSLAQSVTGLATLNSGGHGHGTTLPAGPESTASADPDAAEGAVAEHHHDTHAAADSHEHHDSYAPGILGLISSGSTLVALGMRFYFGHRYGKQIKQRQKEIKSKVEDILARLEKGESTSQVKADLEPLVGPRAMREFSQLWQASHQLANAGAGG